MSFQDIRLKTKKPDQVNLSDFLCFNPRLRLRLIVESPRIELGSKQATKVLSTRLVFIWF